jgi:hypothetical protein
VATWLRRVSAPTLRDHPAATRVALGFLLLLLALWGPVPWTRNVWAMLVLAILAYIWLERVRHVTVAEFPDVPSGELWRRVRSAMPGQRRPAAATADDPLDRLEHLVDLRTRGVLDEAEYERQKAALLAATP